MVVRNAILSKQFGLWCLILKISREFRPCCSELLLFLGNPYPYHCGQNHYSQLSYLSEFIGITVAVTVILFPGMNNKTVMW